MPAQIVSGCTCAQKYISCTLVFKMCEFAQITVLVVDDEPAVLSIVGQMLVQEGFRVLSAATPQEALVLCHEHGAAISLALLDCTMPQMNGPQLVDRLRESFPTLAVVMMSGYAPLQLSHPGMELSQAFLHKPFMMEELLAVLRDALDVERSLPRRRLRVARSKQ